MHVKHRSVRSLIAAAGAFATCSGLLIPSPVFASEPVTAQASMDAIDRATTLRSEGRLIVARDVLLSLVQSDAGVGVSDAERSRAFQLLASLQREIIALPPAALAVEKAYAALASDDLASAERHAASVASKTGATDQQVAEAIVILERVRQQRQNVLDRVPTAIEEAQASLNAGDAARAKSLVESIVRSGIPLDAEQQALVDGVMAGVIAHEDRVGELLDAEPIALGMLQPGVVKRRDDIPAPSNGSGQPESQPESQPAPEATPQAAPEPAPAAAPEPPPAPSHDDLIKQARTFEAQSLLAEADLAFTERRLNEAANKYAQLQGVYRDMLSAEQAAHVDARLTESRLLLRGNVGPEGDIVRGVIEQNKFAKDATIAEFNNLLNQSKSGLASGNVSDARLNALKAQLTLKGARQYFAESEYEGLLKQTTDTLTQIEAAEDRIRSQSIADNEKRIADAARSAALERARDKERRINENIDRVRALQQEMKYEEALQVVDQILFLDPINPSGLVLKDSLTAVVIYRKYHAIGARLDNDHARMVLSNREASVAPMNLMDYPSDWPKISFDRGETAAFREPPENQAVLTRLDKPIPTARFPEGTTLEQAVTFIETVAEMNIDIDWASLEEIGVDRSTPVTLNLSQVPLRTVLDRLLDKASPDRLSRAAWAVNDGILQIASDESLRKNTILAIYDVRDLLIEIPDYDNAPEFDLSQVLQQSGGGGGGGGGQSPFQNQRNNEDEDRLPLDERRQQIIDIIVQNIDPEGWTDNGGDTGRIQPLAGSLIITNTARNHREIGGLLSKLREQRALQINVEARFLLVATGFFEQIGFDLDVYFNSDNNQVRTAQATDPAVQASDFFDFTQGGLQRTITGPGTTPITQNVVNPTAWSPIGAGQNSLGLANSLLTGSLPDGSVGLAALTAAPALGVAGQFLDDIQVDFLVRATQADRRSVQLTAPRLTFMNGQRANISVATQVAFVGDLTPVTSDSAVGFDPTVNTATEGVGLEVDGTVSADRRYVTLNVTANLAKIDGFSQSAVTAVAGGQLVTSAQAQSFVQLPTITTTSVNTTVVIPDQGTILLGGQRLVTEVEVETGVPVLSKIPILNRFFTNRIETTEEQSLLILMKPTILIQNEEEERNFPGLGDATRSGFTG